MYDKRLIGTWQSDKERTARDIRARRDITRKDRARLLDMFGKLSVRYTRTRCFTTFGGSTEVAQLRIAAKDAGGVVILSRTPLTGDDLIYHIRFEDHPEGAAPQYYWISLGPFREFFRKVDRRRRTAR